LISTSSAFSQTTRTPVARHGALRTFSTWAALGAAASVALGFAVSFTSSASAPGSAPAVAAAPLETGPVAVEITAERPRVEPWADASAAAGYPIPGRGDFERARDAIAQGDGKTALDALNRFRASAGSGKLRDEATLLRVQALDLSGERAEARSLAQSFLSEHPDSPQKLRLEALATERPEK
jgi:hypothetical protein